MGCYSDVNMDLEVKEGKIEKIIEILEKYYFETCCLRVCGNRIWYADTIESLGYDYSLGFVKELAPYIKSGTIDFVVETRECTQFEFEGSRILRSDFEYKLKNKEEITLE